MVLKVLKTILKSSSNKKSYQVYTIFIVILLMLCSGCAHFRKKEKEAPFNPIVYDQEFRDALFNKKIKLVAPGSGVESSNLDKLAFLDLNIDIPDNLMSTDIKFHSNSDQTRSKILKKALSDPNSNHIVWALRGGYGCARVIPYLQKMDKPDKEKLFIGFSDNTALHLYFSQAWGWKTVHGAVVNELLSPKRDPRNFQKIADIIAKKVTHTDITELKPLNAKARSNKKIAGRLTGGNLTIVQTSLGTDWQIQAADKIIFLEDNNEEGYKVDRSLNHLKSAGIFKDAKAIVLGEFVGGTEEVELAIQRFADEINIPVYITNQFGHGVKNYPLIYNADSRIFEKKSGSENKTELEVDNEQGGNYVLRMAL